MSNIVKIYARPRLTSPIMLASWPGISNVSMIVANYLARKMVFKKLAEIEASQFFDPIGVLVRDNVVEAPQFPQSRFYYYKNKDTGSEIILFIGDDQPATKGYELAKSVIDLGIKFRVRRIFTCAAMLTRIHHTEQPRVWGVATNPHTTAEIKKYGIMLKGNLQISGLNGLLLGAAKERKLDGVCLLGEVPAYATRIQNPMAALAIIKALTRILDVDIDIGELTQLATATNERLKQVAAEAMGEYIDYFTEPLWERREEEGEEE